MYLSLQQHSPSGLGLVAEEEEEEEVEEELLCLAQFPVIHWDFSVDQFPEPLVSGTLLLHDSAERVILAACCGWKIVLPALGCVFER